MNLLDATRTSPLRRFLPTRRSTRSRRSKEALFLSVFSGEGVIMTLSVLHLNKNEEGGMSENVETNLPVRLSRGQRKGRRVCGLRDAYLVLQHNGRAPRRKESLRDLRRLPHGKGRGG